MNLPGTAHLTLDLILVYDPAFDFDPINISSQYQRWAYFSPSTPAYEGDGRWANEASAESGRFRPDGSRDPQFSARHPPYSSRNV